MNQRYIRNIGSLTASQQKKLSKKTIMIVGLGGLGGYLAQGAARLGIGNLIICDNGVFDVTNLNRQVFSNTENIGISKVEVTKEELNKINPDCHVVSYDASITDIDMGKIIMDCDVVVDALDGVETRLILEKACNEQNKILIHAAVNGWVGQITTIFPFENMISKLYCNNDLPDHPSVLPMTAAIVANYQLSETVKVLLSKPKLHGKLLIIDLQNYRLSKVKTI